MRTGVFLAALALASLALAACAPGVQPLLDEYNALFGSVTERGQEAAGDGGDWLQDIYPDVAVDGTLNLHAPEHCSSYKWTVAVDPGLPDVSLPTNFDVMDYGGNTSWLRLDLKKAGFMPGYYIVSCEAVRGEETLRDSCKVVIVEPSAATEASAGGGST